MVQRLNRRGESEAKEGLCKSLQVEEEDQDYACTTVENEESVEAGKTEDKEDFSPHCHCKADVKQHEHDELESTKNLSNGEQNNEHEQPEAEKNLTAEKVFPPAQPNTNLCPCTGKELGTEDDVISKREEESNGSSGRRKEKTAFTKGSEEIANREAFQKNYDSSCSPGSYTRSNAEDKREQKGNGEMASMDIKEGKKNVAGMDNAVSVEPSTEQLRAVVIEILKEVDFDVTTLADVFRQLGTHFNSDLMHRKKEIKNLLEEVISETIDDEEYEESNDDKDMRHEEEDEDGENDDD
ncbi:hypothetical protein HPP92_000345 [Vanilla planifolia]|uniref:DEK-C domain-containing protein n=1 Tax=Vanilla planifolia TaxID=51239 RepID=A0A835VKG6_VANPL|nr:hypothetical protein HPP92_000345 [Vanilla planifolia]